MECGGVSLEGRHVAEQEEDDLMAACELEEEEGGQMVASELEAAEALVGLAQCSASCGGALVSGEFERQLATEAAVSSTRLSQDQPISRQEFCDYASTKITSPEKTQKVVQNIPSRLCSTSCQPNSVSKLRRKLSEAEKEAQKLRRILANRESARQTIRRRQAMYLGLTRKAAGLLEENENLKKRKELAVEEYISLKGGNEFLKAQLAKLKMAEPGEMPGEPRTSEAEKSCSATTSTPYVLLDQPSMVPYFWPSIPPYLDVLQLQRVPPSNVPSSSQFPVPRRDICSSCQGQDNSTRPGAPLFVFPVPWLLSFRTHSSALPSHSGTNNRQNAHQCSACSRSETLLHADNNQLSSDQNKRTDASSPQKNMSDGSVHGAGFTFPPESGGQYTAYHPKGTILGSELFGCAHPLEGLGCTRNCQVDDTSDVNVISAPKRVRHEEKNQEPIICHHSETVFAAMEARRRRKELMKMKNIHHHPVQTQY